MVDTNVIISALLKQGSVPDSVIKDVCENHELVLCDQIITESYKVVMLRFPNKVEVLEDLFARLRFDLVPAPETDTIQIKDQPIFNAAITSNVDILITGDRHFLELDQEILQILTPSQYKEKYNDKNIS